MSRTGTGKRGGSEAEALRRDMLVLWVRRRMVMRAGLPPGALVFEGRRDLARHEARARAAYLLHAACGLTFADIARALDWHPRSVGRAVARLEEDRDDPVFDADMADLTDELSLLRLWLDGWVARQSPTEPDTREMAA